MSNTRIVKIDTILGNQIPSFLSNESPLFQEFLKQYYISQTHSTGVLNVAEDIQNFKKLSTYTNDLFYTLNTNCYLVERLDSFSDIIQVNSTYGFPSKYGLIQIDDEIITYTNKTDTEFIGCARAFSGITEINDNPNTSGLVFSTTDASEHNTKSIVKNLNILFYSKLFEKFKAQYLPDFENRDFDPEINLELVLSRARDFYLSKGTDISFQILFEILYNDSIRIFKPKENIIIPSASTNVLTKNILVELISGSFVPDDLIGLTLYQDLTGGITASASIYNVEFRPVDELNLYEISLDSDSFIYDFVSTKRTSVIETVENGIIVDSTVGFPDSGSLYIKVKNVDLTYTFVRLNYSEKTLTKFLNITDIDSTTYASIKSNDDAIEDNLVYSIKSDGSILTFRLLNVIQSFNYSNTNTIQTNDIITIDSFGENLSGFPEYTSWIYNYPTYHKVKGYDSSGFIDFYNPVSLIKNENIILVSSSGISTSSKIINILSNTKIQVSTLNFSSIPNIDIVRETIQKSSLNPTEPAYVQNTYLDESNNELVVASSGLPYYDGNTKLNSFTFNLVGVGSIFETRKTSNNSLYSHNLLSGSRIYLNSNNVGISTGYYFVKKQTDNSISLYKSTGDLSLSFFSPNNDYQINLNNNSSTALIGTGTIVGYENLTKGYSNQLILKSFPVKTSYNENKINSSVQINNIEDAYSKFSI